MEQGTARGRQRLRKPPTWGLYRPVKTLRSTSLSTERLRRRVLCHAGGVSSVAGHSRARGKPTGAPRHCDVRSIRRIRHHSGCYPVRSDGCWHCVDGRSDGPLRLRTGDLATNRSRSAGGRGVDDGPRSMRVSGSQIRNSPGTGISFQSYAQWPGTLTVDKSEVSGGAGNGIGGAGVTPVRISSTKVSDNHGNGLSLGGDPMWGGPDTTVTDSVFDNNGGTGFVSSLGLTLVQGNTVSAGTLEGGSAAAIGGFRSRIARSPETRR